MTDETLHPTIVELFQDSHFRVKLQKCITRLSTDPPYIEVYDIPEVLLTIVEFTGRHQVGINNLGLSELPEVWEALLTHALETFDAIPDDEGDNFRHAIQGCVKLLLVTPDSFARRRSSLSTWFNGFTWLNWMRGTKVSSCCRA